MATVLQCVTTDFVTVPTAAKQLGLEKVTLYHWIDDQSIIAVRFGGKLFIPISEIERLKTISDFVTITAAAKQLGCTKNTIYNWINTQKINVNRFGSKLFIPISEIERLKTISNFVTVAAAAKQLGLSRMTLYEWIDKRKINADRFGGKLFIPVSEIERIKNNSK